MDGTRFEDNLPDDGWFSTSFRTADLHGWFYLGQMVRWMMMEMNNEASGLDVFDGVDVFEMAEEV